MKNRGVAAAIGVMVLTVLLATVTSSPLGAVSNPARTAKLFVGAVGTNDPVFRYEVGDDGSATLDLTLTHPTFALPGFFAFSPAGEMFVVNNRGGINNRGSVSRFLDPHAAMPMFNGSIESGDFASPHWATFRGEELFIGQSEGNVLRFVFDAAGAAVPNGAITGPAGVVEVNPATGELFIPQCCSPHRIDRYLIDASGNAVFNGTITGGGLSAPHDVALSPWGELFAVNGSGNSISRFVFDAAGNASANGVITESTLNVPLGIDFSPWGEMFVANRNNGLIHRWTFDGSFNAVFRGSLQHVAGIHDLQFAPPAVVQVAIDIKPGSYPNSINIGSNGKVPVAILSSPDFDATTVDPLTVTLANGEVWLRGNGTPMSSLFDVDGDGLTDIVVHVATESLLLSDGDTEAVVEGETFDGIAFTGTDLVRIVPQD